MRIIRTMIGCSATAFTFSVCYWFYLFYVGHIKRDAAAGYVVKLYDHGAIVYVTHAQYMLLAASWIGATAFFLIGYLLNERYARSQVRISVHKRK
jgi:hypothetical protein